MTFEHSTVLGVTTSLLANTVLVGVEIGFTGSLSSDTDLSTLRDAEVAAEEINAADGMGGEKLVLASADTGEDVIKGIGAYKYPAETEEVDFIASGFTDDVGLGQLPRMQESQIPTLDTWTPYVGIIDMVTEDSGTMAPYFMNIASDEALAVLYINFGANVLKKEMDWDNIVILTKDTVFGKAIIGFVAEALGPVTGVEIKEIITYDIGTVDFAPLFSKAQASGADFIYQVSSVNSRMISSQYVKLQVSIAMTDVNASTLGLEYWEDTGGTDGGIPILLPVPSVGFKLDPESQKPADTYQAKYDNRSKIPHFNGFSAYQGLKQAAAATKATGGSGDARAWSAEMKKQDIMPRRDGRMWLRYAFWGDGGIEEAAGRTYPHNIHFGLTAPYDNTQPSMAVTQWKGDGEVDVVYPPEYTTTKSTVPSWVK